MNITLSIKKWLGNVVGTSEMPTVGDTVFVNKTKTAIERNGAPVTAMRVTGIDEKSIHLKKVAGIAFVPAKSPRKR